MSNGAGIRRRATRCLVLLGAVCMFDPFVTFKQMALIPAERG
jgi:hypothetical protein